MTQFDLAALFLLLYFQLAAANVEKVVFLGPSSVQIPTQKPTLDDLQLPILSPEDRTIRTKLRAEFPTNTSIWGEPSWVLLEKLTEGQRYEVRICWAVTQPTSFRLYVYELSEVFDSPELITSLATYSETRQSEAELCKDQTPSIFRSYKSERGTDQLQSVLLLRILAAADYYTTNRTLMEHVPPVFVDVILDPFLLNVLPQSLVPTGIYLIIVAISSWYLAKCIAKWLHMVGRMDEQRKDV